MDEQKSRIKTLEMRLAAYRGALRLYERELADEVRTHKPRTAWFYRFFHESLKAKLDALDREIAGISYVEVID